MLTPSPRLLVTAMATALALTACTSVAETAGGGTSGSASAAPCAGVANTPDVTTTAGWLAYIREHRDNIGISISPLAGATSVEHNAASAFPTASSMKLIHLVAYAQLVASRKINPNSTVSVADWDRWYFPTDGGAHPAALKELGIPVAADGRAATPERTVTIAQMMQAMITHSDSAAPDWLRARVGDAPLRAVMNEFGFTGSVPTLVGLYLGISGQVPPDVDPWQLAQRYSADSAFRAASIEAAGTVSVATQLKGSENSWAASPTAFTKLARAVALDGFAGAEVARRIMEWQGPMSGGVLGFKGGSLPGVATEVFEFRPTQGAPAIGVLMIRGLSVADAKRDTEAKLAHQTMLLEAMTDPAVATSLRCALDSN